MSKKLFTKFFVFLLVVGLLFAVAPTRQAHAADIPVVCLGTDDTALLQGAITGATDGDVINVSGTCVLSANITVSKDVTLDGGGTASIKVSGTGYRISMTTAGATLQGFDIEKTDKTGGQDIIYIGASNVTIANNKVHGQFVIGDGEVARAIVISGGNSGLLITGNEFYALRQPAYISGVTTGTISNNYTHGTKGWVLEQGDMTFTNNTWGTVALGNPNVYDIAILSGVNATYYTDVPAMSVANNNAFIEDQRYSPARLTPVYVDASAPACTDCGTERMPYQTIQAAVNRVIAGGTIHVAAGTYNEDIDVTKPVTLLGPNAGIPGNGNRVAEAIIQGTNASWVSLYVEPNTPGVTIDGFKFDGANLAPDGYSAGVAGDSSDLTVQNNVFVNHDHIAIITSGVYTPDGGATWLYDKWLTDVLIKDNLIINDVASLSQYNYGIYFQSSLGSVTGNVVTNYRSGIQVQPYWNTPGGGTIEGNTFNVYKLGIYFNYTQNSTADWLFKDNIISGLPLPAGQADTPWQGIRVETFSAGNVSFEENQVDFGTASSTQKYVYFENNVTGGTSSATPNWWGSAAGPEAGAFVGTAEYIPWCGDAECSFLVYLAGSDLQVAIDATPAGGVLYVPDIYTDATPDYTDGGADGYNVAGKTIILGDGVIIQNSSPCFTVTGSYTTITTESIGGATCIPTSGSNGIDVDGGLENIIIEGIYFDTTQSDYDIYGVISFNGAVADVLVNDNYFHTIDYPFVYDGIVFTTPPTGLVEIKGNLFEMSGIYGCAVNNDNNKQSAPIIDAQFNSFGSMDGHPASVPDVRVCNNVDYSNYTHADVYLESSATPWANQEVVGQEFTLTVKANLTKVTGAKFTLKYDPALVALDKTSLTNLSGFSAAGLKMFEVDETLGLITFNASAYPAITGTGLSLFSADFTASAVGAALFEVDALSDEFAMFPGYASSSNVYGYTLLPVTVDLIELPTVASTFGDSYYLVGEARDFTMTVTNFDTAYAAPELRITIPSGLTLTYNSAEYTGNLVVDLADLAVDEKVTIDLTATFTTPFNTTAAVLDVDLVDALTPEELLVDTSFSAFAYTKPTVTVGSDPYFLVGVPGDFSVTIVNPETGRNYGDSIVFDIVIEDHVVEDISAVSCTMGTQTWDLIGELEQDDADVVARIEGLTGGFFTVPANFTAPISCSITYATPGTYAVSGYMVEGISSPERIVSDTYSATAQVYTQPVISSDNLDGPFQAGLAQGVTLTITNPDGIPEPFDLVFTLPEGTVILYNGTEYTCLSTGCPVIPLVAGAVPGDIDFTITFPVEYTAGTADVSVSLYDRDTVGAPSPLATLSMEDVVVYANVASVTGTVSMQGRTTRAGVLFTLAGGFDTYTATSINTLSNNVSFTNLASGVYAITVEQARYLDITITHGATIDLATLQAIVNLELRAGDANDDNYINGGDASIVGGQYGTGTIADQGDINFDNKVNIQDLALVGGNFDFQSANPTHPTLPYAYGTWMK